MVVSTLANPTVRGLGALYGGTFLSGAWAMIISDDSRAGAPDAPAMRADAVKGWHLAAVKCRLFRIRDLDREIYPALRLFTISGMIVFAMIIPAGFLMDRVGRKWCTVPSTGLPGLVFLSIPFTDNFAQLALLAGIAGLAQGLSLGSLATSTYDVVPARAAACRRCVARSPKWAAALRRSSAATWRTPSIPARRF